MLPPKLPKKPKRETRWRSQAHLNFVRGHACSVCHATEHIEVAHVRLGSGAGMGQKPDDWRTVSLCRDCHAKQHQMGEISFWRPLAAGTGRAIHPRGDIDMLINAFCKASPKATEIARIRKERNV